MSDDISERQRALAVKIAKPASPEEKVTLSKWIERVLEIRATDLSSKEKAKHKFMST